MTSSHSSRSITTAGSDRTSPSTGTHAGASRARSADSDTDVGLAGSDGTDIDTDTGTAGSTGNGIDAGTDIEVLVTVNGVPLSARVPARRLLSDFLRHDLRLTGTHVGCEHGVCGACTVLLDGAPVRSCLAFAVSIHGREITTIEGLAADDGSLHPVQQAFQDEHGLQCGYCTPGFVMSACGFLADEPAPDDDAIREGMAGNLCRCTGYAGILAAVKQAAGALRGSGADPRAKHDPTVGGGR